MELKMENGFNKTIIKLCNKCLSKNYTRYTKLVINLVDE
jgi:hypothetical protein